MAVPTPTHLSPIIRVRTDKRTIVVTRTGRFSMEADCAKDPRHCLAAIYQAQEEFIENRRRSHGEEYVEHGQRFSGFLVRGPYAHVGVSTDSTPDPGFVKPPDPRDVEAVRRFERAERARIAKKLATTVESHGMVDYELIAHFKVTFDNGYRTRISDHHEVKAALAAGRAADKGLVTASR